MRPNHPHWKNGPKAPRRISTTVRSATLIAPMRYWPSGTAEAAFQQIQTALETLRDGGQEAWAAVLQAQMVRAQAISDRLKDK
jgi:hypothetical protein